MSREIVDEGRTGVWLCQTAKLVSLYYSTLFGRLFLRLISRLWLFCCERKILFHG
jgi:hypothetical protein